MNLEVLGALTAGLAHDFKNLLTPIQIAAELELSRGHKDPKLCRHLSVIHSSTQRAVALMSKILNLSRQTTFSAEIISLDHLLQEVLDLVRETFPKTIRISTDLPAHSLFVVGDASQLHLALLNICLNAEHAMRGGPGRLSIRLRSRVLPFVQCVKDVVLPPGNYADLEIIDSGRGIEPGLIEKVFLPFFTTKPKGEGTGLGLPAVFGVIQSMKGGLQVASAPGKGSRFRILLPAYRLGHEGTPD